MQKAQSLRALKCCRLQGFVQFLTCPFPLRNNPSTTNSTWTPTVWKEPLQGPELKRVLPESPAQESVHNSAPLTIISWAETPSPSTWLNHLRASLWKSRVYVMNECKWTQTPTTFKQLRFVLAFAVVHITRASKACPTFYRAFEPGRGRSLSFTSPQQ